jgi:4-amino-4-deoxy-L-arabinose transferase-like glycosyltransferase
MPSTRSGVLVALVVFAAGMALFSERLSFAFYDHPDEPGKVAQVLHHAKNFRHPLLMLTSAELARKAFLHGTAKDDPQRVVETGRLVVAGFAAASAALLALVAARLHGIWAGVLVGLLVVTQPLLYELAHYFKEDPVLLFGWVACAGAAHHHATHRDAPSLVLLGVAAGVAAAGKYVGAAWVPVAAALGASSGATGRERWKRAGAVAGCAVLTWLVIDFRIFRSPAGIVPQSLAYEIGKAFAGKHGLAKEVPHAFYAGVQARYGGWWVPALAALWAAFAIYRPRKIPVAEWLLAGTSAAFLIAFSFTPKTSERYYLPIAVALCYLAVAGAFHWVALAPRARIAATAAAVVLCLAAGFAQARDTRELRAAFERDDRTELIAAVAGLPPTAIVVQDQSVGLPEPGRRWQDAGRAPLPQRILGAKQAPDLGSLAELRARGVTYLALCRRTFGTYFDADHVVRDEAHVSARRAFYRTALERGRVLREWEPGPVTYLQPGLVLVDISGVQ